MKRVGILLILLLVIGIIPCTFASNKPNVKAVSAVLMDDKTGKVLFSKNPLAIMAPASTTKIMTAVIVLEHLNLDKVVRISQNAASREGTSMGLAPGEQRTVKELLYGMMLVSGNDAATALAETVSGSEEKFAQLMTEKARSIGMQNTQFKNASGLPVIGHSTTAYDMAILTRYALNVPGFAKIVSTVFKDVHGEGRSQSRHLKNHNKLLWKYPYATGVKTGYTISAGGCLVSSANRGGRTLISVVLKTPKIYDDSIELFEYGFNYR